MLILAGTATTAADVLNVARVSAVSPAWPVRWHCSLSENRSDALNIYHIPNILQHVNL